MIVGSTLSAFRNKRHMCKVKRSLIASRLRAVAGLLCVLAASTGPLLAGAPKDGIEGHTFRYGAIGLTYNFPVKFAAKVENEMNSKDPTGREHTILALWDTPDRAGAPRISFLYDHKARSADLSQAEIANRYLNAIRQMWVSVPGVRISGPQKISGSGFSMWRLDLYQPDQLPHFNSAVVIPLPDRRILAIQLNAPSQSELDAENESLRDLHFDSK